MGESHEEHGPECTCGCHDHSHGHEHGHGHEHHHHDHADVYERSVELEWGTAALESHVHDQASTVSATINARAETGKTFETLVQAMRDIARQAELSGGIIGHIKAYARAADSFAHASATDAQHAPSCEGDVQMPLSPGVQCQIVAIVLLIDLDQLERMVVDVLGA